MRIAVLITCHNRAEKTLKFMRSLRAQRSSLDYELHVFLNDDGSSDGTMNDLEKFCADLKLANHGCLVKKIEIIQGSGNDFWCGGMRRAWRRAVEHGPWDYFLWANDDVELYCNAVDVMLQVAKDPSRSSVGVVCGAFCDPHTGGFTYGGRDSKRLLVPDGVAHKCRYIHGNAVLVPWSTYEKLGMFDSRWTHGFGDTDYGLCCIEAGLFCWTTPCYIGTCVQHEIKGPWHSSSVQFAKRWKLMHAVTGGNFREFVMFRKKHYSWRWRLDAIKFFLQVLFPKPFEWYRK